MLVSSEGIAIANYIHTVTQFNIIKGEASNDSQTKGNITEALHTTYSLSGYSFNVGFSKFGFHFLPPFQILKNSNICERSCLPEVGGRD